MEIIKIPELFGIENIMSVKEIESGHINSTFLVESKGGKYILQSVNRSVFKDPVAVMRNISAIERAFERSGSKCVSVPHYIVKDGRNYIESDGEFWRLYSYSENFSSDSRNYNTGYSFGTFIRVIEGTELEMSVENFHDFGTYIEKLRKVSSIPDEIEEVYSKVKEVFLKVPKRNIHADAKSANIALGERSTVIDLDTAMYSYTALDYGDLVRSSCTGNVVNIESIEDITRGFADGLDGILTDDEVNSLYYGILWSTAELSVRYLTDSFSEEMYFKGKTREQCRKRGIELKELLSVFRCNEGVLKGIVDSAFDVLR